MNRSHHHISGVYSELGDKKNSNDSQNLSEYGAMGNIQGPNMDQPDQDHLAPILSNQSSNKSFQRSVTYREVKDCVKEQIKEQGVDDKSVKKVI